MTYNLINKMEFIKWYVKSLDKNQEQIGPVNIFGLFKFTDVDKEIYGEKHMNSIIEKYNQPAYEKNVEDYDDRLVFIEETEEAFKEKAIEIFKNILNNATI